VRLDYHTVQYLYNDGSLYYFMDLETYDQPAISSEMIGDAVGYLKEGLEVKLTFYDKEPLDIDLPITVDLAVVQADVAVRGDTATGVTKKVTTETGLAVQVPNFVEEGNVIRVDTRTGAYITRV
jgi:elongation factor P